MTIHRSHQRPAAEPMSAAIDADAVSSAPTAVPWSAVLRRAAAIGAAIGSALALINQGAALFREAPVQTLPLILGFATPFAVIALSQVLGHRAYWRRAVTGRGNDESVWQTLIGHGIPVRALTVAGLVGSLMTPIIIALSPAGAAGISPIPWSQVAQVYGLPLVFGVLTQALAYRRARTADRAGARQPAAEPKTELMDGMAEEPQ